MAESSEFRYIARNRKARHDFDLGDRFEAGIELRGTEVKSIREGKVNLSDAYATISRGEVVLKNLHITQYKMASAENHDPLRDRRLLLHKREIRKLTAQIEQKGMTLIPLAIYLKGPLIKIELALATGRKKYDKREAIAREDAKKRIQRAMRKDV